MSAVIEKVIDFRHGGPYDRGSADSYYLRKYNPHYYTGPTGLSTRVEITDMTVDEINEYAKGFYDNEAQQNFKDYG